MNTMTIEQAQSMGAGVPEAVDAAPDHVALRVQGGMHDGAMTTLGPGSYLIGGAAHCDFVLHDEGVADEHLLLNVSSSGALLRAMADGVSHDGVRVRVNGQFALGGPACVQLGPVNLALRYGQADASSGGWPEAAGRGRGAATLPLLDQARLQVKRRPVLSVVLGALLLAGLIGLAMSAANGGMFGWGDQAGSKLEHARGVLAELSLNEVRVEPAAGGALQLSGYVPDGSALRRIRHAFGPSGVRLSVYPADELVRFAREWMAAHGYPVAVAYAGAGQVALSGSDTGKPGFELAASQLQQEIPGLAGIKSTITPLAAAAPPPPAAPKPDEPYVLAGVSGVNAGAAVPYLTAGSTYIFRGGALKNGMTVVDIESNRVLVDDHGVTTTQEVRIR